MVDCISSSPLSCIFKTVSKCSMFCCTLLYVHCSIAIILIGKRELVALLNLVMVERLFLAVPWGCLRFVIVVFPDHTHLLFLKQFTQPGRYHSVVWFHLSKNSHSLTSLFVDEFYDAFRNIKLPNQPNRFSEYTNMLAKYANWRPPGCDIICVKGQERLKKHYISIQ